MICVWLSEPKIFSKIFLDSRTSCNFAISIYLKYFFFKLEIISIIYLSPKTYLSKNWELTNIIEDLMKKFSKDSYLSSLQIRFWTFINEDIMFSKESFEMLLRLLSDESKTCWNTIYYSSLKNYLANGWKKYW